MTKVLKNWAYNCRKTTRQQRKKTKFQQPQATSSTPFRRQKTKKNCQRQLSKSLSNCRPKSLSNCRPKSLSNCRPKTSKCRPKTSKHLQCKLTPTQRSWQLQQLLKLLRARSKKRCYNPTKKPRSLILTLTVPALILSFFWLLKR